ncbi:MAG: NAD(P)/FAD-dependent oxidoreductase [Clostridia bacterium]|nr:NAD(P)/FAD-dependent oxidoreductase [Clostridia bacterium]
MMSDKYDVCIIGAGVVGCAVARELSKYDLRICVVEKEEDICSGSSKANSGIVHAGYDAVPGTLKAKMNVRGAELIKQLSKTLDFPFRQNGSMVICFKDEDLPRLKELYDRGIENGVKDISVISGDEARALDGAISEDVKGALLAKGAGIVCPFGMTAAFAENAAANGAEFRFLESVENIEKTDGGYRVFTNKGRIETKYVVNAAGLYSDRLHNAVSGGKIRITPRRGEYVLLDKEVGDLVSHTVFQLPDGKGKGVLVLPTVHGNILVGPSAVDTEDKEDTSTTAEYTGFVKEKALMSVPSIPFGKTITGFSGLRAHEAGGDFILGEPYDAPGFFDAAGIESPGLTAAPAIGEYLAEQIAKASGAEKKNSFISERRAIPEVAKLPFDERSDLIKNDPAYGRIVCRCEGISEGEIIDAIRRTPGAKSLDGIKKRVRQGMGRCQGGFCTPAAMEILSRELGIPMTQVRKNRPGSEQITE